MTEPCKPAALACGVYSGSTLFVTSAYGGGAGGTLSAALNAAGNKDESTAIQSERTGGPVHRRTADPTGLNGSARICPLCALAADGFPRTSVSTSWPPAIIHPTAFIEAARFCRDREGAVGSRCHLAEPPSWPRPRSAPPPGRAGRRGRSGALRRLAGTRATAARAGRSTDGRPGPVAAPASGRAT